jgi:hypothetical protein
MYVRNLIELKSSIIVQYLVPIGAKYKIEENNKEEDAEQISDELADDCIHGICDPFSFHWTSRITAIFVLYSHKSDEFVKKKLLEYGIDMDVILSPKHTSRFSEFRRNATQKMQLNHITTGVQ